MLQNRLEEHSKEPPSPCWMAEFYLVQKSFWGLKTQILFSQLGEGQHQVKRYKANLPEMVRSHWSWVTGTKHSFGIPDCWCQTSTCAWRWGGVGGGGTYWASYPLSLGNSSRRPRKLLWSQKAGPHKGRLLGDGLCYPRNHTFKNCYGSWQGIKRWEKSHLLSMAFQRDVQISHICA